MKANQTHRARKSSPTRAATPARLPQNDSTSADRPSGGPDLVDMIANVMIASGMEPLEAATFLVRTAVYFTQQATGSHAEYDAWKAMTMAVLGESQWPWPTRESGPVPGGGGQTWADLDDQLQQEGSSLEECVRKLRQGTRPA